MRDVLLIAILVSLLAGCTVGRGTGILPPAADSTAQPPLSGEDSGRDYRMLVANGLSETVTLVERTAGVWNVTKNVLATGQAPNQMIVRDGFCYVVNSLSNSIQVIDLESMTSVREISTGVGTNPLYMDFVDDNTAMVTCYISNEVLLIDLAPDCPPENRIIDRIPMPSSSELPHDDGVTTQARPGGLAIVGDRAYVVSSNLQMAHVAGGPGVLVEIDIPKRLIVGAYNLAGRDTTQVLHSPRFPDRLVILSAGDNDIATGFVGNGLVESLDLNSGEVFQIIKVNGAPFGGEIGPNDILFMENGKESVVLRADLRKGVELAGHPLPTYGEPLSYASSILALPGLVCVTNFNADRLCLIEPDSGEVLAELATGDGPDAIVLIE